MPRRPRLVGLGATYHVTARGNRRQTIFIDDYDRRLFLAILGDTVVKHRWRCAAYCLLSNHFHLVVETPVAASDLSNGMHRLNGRYAQWFNERHGLDGHLFQDRFHSLPIERDGHLLETIRYVFLNPVRAGVSHGAADWPWSSYRATLGRAPAPPFLAPGIVLDLFARDLEAARGHLGAFVDA
jgi:REP element-mobilizing transposase RayT